MISKVCNGLERMGMFSLLLSSSVSSSGRCPLTRMMAAISFRGGNGHDVFVCLQGDPYISFLGMSHDVT